MRVQTQKCSGENSYLCRQITVPAQQAYRKKLGRSTHLQILFYLQTSFFGLSHGAFRLPERAPALPVHRDQFLKLLFFVRSPLLCSCLSCNLRKKIVNIVERGALKGRKSDDMDFYTTSIPHDEQQINQTSPLFSLDWMSGGASSHETMHSVFVPSVPIPSVIRCSPDQLSLSLFSWPLEPAGAFPSAGCEAWWQSFERQPSRRRALLSTYTIYIYAYRWVRGFSENAICKCSPLQSPKINTFWQPGTLSEVKNPLSEKLEVELFYIFTTCDWFWFARLGSKFCFWSEKAHTSLPRFTAYGP